MPSRSSRALGTALALTLATVSCGTHVVVGREERQKSTSAPDATLDAGSGVQANPDAGELVCGSNVCKTQDLGAGFGVGRPCCFSTNKCGASLSNVCVELDSPGVLDSACSGTAPYSGCCRPDGTCGIAATGTAFGCVNPFFFFPTMVLGACTYAERPDAAP